MPSEPPGLQGGERRLHPASILFSIWQPTKVLIPTLVFLGYSASSGYRTWTLLGLLLLIPISAGAAVKHLRYRYRVAEDELIIRHGILGRYERHIPFHRIQDIRLIQNPVHRLLGVAAVKIETAGGAEVEAEMNVLAVAEVEAIRRRVFGRPAPSPSVPHGAAAGDSGEEAGEEIVRFTPWDTVKAGLTQGRGWLVFGAAGGIAWEMADNLGWSGAGLQRLLGEATGTAFFSLPGPVEVLLIIAAVVLLFRLLSVAWALVSLHGFTLTRTGGNFQVTTGLITRIQASIPAGRVQAVRVSETSLQRLFDLVSVKARTAGGTGGEGAEPTRGWIAPSLSRHRLGSLLAQLVPTVELNRLEWHGVDPRARRRIIRVWLLALGALGLASVAAGVATGGAGFVLLILPAAATPLALLNARYEAEALGYALTGRAIVLRRGWWRRRLQAVESGRIQSVSVRQSPFDRRYGMAVLSIDTAGGSSLEGALELPYLPLETARELQETLTRRVARTRFTWVRRS